MLKGESGYVPIQVTRSFLPPLDEYVALLKTVWDSHHLTNGGPLLLQLIDELKAFLQVPHLLAVNNGTTALQLAIRALELEGEILTTPFSYVATSSAIAWQGCTPVFVDIEPDSWCIDPSKIEQAITAKTSAILATHVFGNPCDVTKLEQMASHHGLKVIYDGAHAFGVDYLGRNLLSYGDVSVCSFHATKLFHTAEGGCLVTPHESLLDKLVWVHNLGHDGPEAFHGLGTNGKANELQAALGLAILPYVRDVIQRRREVVEQYDRLLPGSLQRMRIRDGTDWNFSYLPILLGSQERLLAVCRALNDQKIFPRRYFYPALNTLDFLSRKSMPVAEDVASRVLCLPIAHDLPQANVEQICEILNRLTPVTNEA